MLPSSASLTHSPWPFYVLFAPISLLYTLFSSYRYILFPRHVSSPTLQFAGWPCLVLPRPTLSSALSCHVSCSYPVLQCLESFLALFCPVRLLLFCSVLPCHAICWPILPCVPLSFRVLSFQILYYPPLPKPFLPFSSYTLSCPVLSSLTVPLLASSSAIRLAMN